MHIPKACYSRYLVRKLPSPGKIIVYLLSVYLVKTKQFRRTTFLIFRFSNVVYQKKNCHNLEDIVSLLNFCHSSKVYNSVFWKVHTFIFCEYSKHLFFRISPMMTVVNNSYHFKNSCDNLTLMWLDASHSAPSTTIYEKALNRGIPFF